MVSTDGLSWSPMVKDTTNVFSRVIYTNELYVASTGSTIFTSTNGTNWIQRNFPTNAHVNGITFGIRNVVAVGSTNSAPPTGPIAFVSDPFVAINPNPGIPPLLKISGLQGRSYQIESTDILPGNAGNWRTNTTLQLTNSPCFWLDTAATNSQSFYRAVLLP
jgi:hypothetical protein